MKQKILLSILSVILLLSLLNCIAEVKYPSVESVSISPEEITTLEIGQSQKFTATVLGENNPPKSVTWGVSGNNSSTTIIDSNGLLTVAMGETSTALVVQAKSTFDPGVSGEASVNVVRHIISSVVVSPNSIDVAPGDTQNFTATVNGTNDPPQTVIWSVSGNNSSATTVDTEGLLTIAEVETSTALVVQATSTYDTSKSGNASVAVLIPTVTSVVVSPNPAIVSLGGIKDFATTVNGENNPPQTVTWSLFGNNSSTTIINTNGQLYVDNNETSVSLIVQATSTYDPSKSGYASVNILLSVGDIITFGAYEWKVLDIQDNKALIVTESILMRRQYHTQGGSNSWADSSLRYYLNNVFYYSSAFSNNDRSRIVQVSNTNENNQWYGTQGGEDTLDKIFLLSIAEVVQYFGDSGQLENRPHPYAWFITDQFNSNRIALFNGFADNWWLRSSGSNSGNTSYISESGEVNMEGGSVFFSLGIRPASWISY
ncbi:MAG: DUF6273 domain-containing protein [Candidatus Cloacimonetes bacterium]|nr:DUF6273 domain-containing protein [Candidatus Cloacimonadota bacterium]